MNKNLIIAVVATAIICGGAGYALGKKSIGEDCALKTPAILGDQGQGAKQFAGRNGVGGNMNRGTRGGIVSGEVLSRDATSMTVKLEDGSTRIVFIGADTSVTTVSSSSQKMLTVGANVRVMGEPAEAGALTAKRVDVKE